MIAAADPPVTVIALVDRFIDNIAAYKSEHYNEARLRQEFIDPLFEALGWDMANTSSAAEAYKEVIHEDSIRDGRDIKAPDYCFSIGGARKFFVEAKKPAVNIKRDSHAAYQLRRYAWSSKLTLSILMNFEGIAIYDCRSRPNRSDSAHNSRVGYFDVRDISGWWKSLSELFSRESVWKGYFDKYLDSGRSKKGTAEVDNAFLSEIEHWRDILARNIAARNHITVSEINFAVQRLIDRIIFLRISEDRGIERYRRLMDAVKLDGVYTRLSVLFKEADERYNSGLFHFYADNDRDESPDTLSLQLAIDDRVLREIISGLYYPDCPYEFSVLPADILGQVYERFLGKRIRLTSRGAAKVENTPEVKKAGGVFYTPTYIVDFIVREALEPLIRNARPADVARLRIVDPACGSGSFLLGAYQFLLDWHRRWFESNQPGKHQKELYRGPGDTWRLTGSMRRKILLNNIYGVDIDAQAVEVTKLSLLLKVLEGETEETVTAQFRMFHERALPDLGKNIKCGNSLIATDFLKFSQGSLLGQHDATRVNVFDWDAEFGHVMGTGGFDAVIGNPPWGASFSLDELEYLRRVYGPAVARTVDSYIYFLYRATQLSKPSRPIGFIIPSTLLNQSDAMPIRKLFLSRGIGLIANLGQGIFGTRVLNTSTILVSYSNSHRLRLGNLSAMAIPDRKSCLQELPFVFVEEWRAMVAGDPDFTFFSGDPAYGNLLLRMRAMHPALLSALEGPIQRGISPDVVDAHVVSQAQITEYALEEDLLKPSISSKQIKRYQEWCCDQFIIYTERNTPINQYPNVGRHLANYKHLNTCKEVLRGKHPWWALHRPRDPAIFIGGKFIGLTTSKKIELVYDPDKNAVATDAMYVMRLRAGLNPWLFLCMMQSRFMLFLYRIANQGESRVIPQIKASKLQTLPFPLASCPEEVGLVLSKLVLTLFKLNSDRLQCTVPHSKDALDRQVVSVEARIDSLVYELYGLSEADIRLVEDFIREG